MVTIILRPHDGWMAPFHGEFRAPLDELLHTTLSWMGTRLLGSSQLITIWPFIIQTSTMTETPPRWGKSMAYCTTNRISAWRSIICCARSTSWYTTLGHVSLSLLHHESDGHCENIYRVCVNGIRTVGAVPDPLPYHSLQRLYHHVVGNLSRPCLLEPMFLRDSASCI